MIEKFFLAFIPVFVAIDPIGLVAVFIGLGTSASREQRKRQAFLGILTALCVAIGFIFLGKLIFSALGITVADFQVAGGLILLGLAGRELLSLGPHDRGGGDEFGIVPLGMPLIAGPALLTALLILVDTVGLVFTLISLLVNLALVAIAFCNADRFTRWMGKQGLRGVSKIIALLLAAIAVSLIRRGWHGAG
jgi:multiple antibiotic resistance protein